MKSNGKVDRLETEHNKLSPGGIMISARQAKSSSERVGSIKEKATILVIDNSRDFTQAVKGTLEKTGRYLVVEENDSSKAHQTAFSFKPDLILLDIAMPETDGGQVAAWIQADPALHRIPIVFLTALVTTAEGRAGLRIQGHSFLAKPITFPELVKGIEENLPARAAFL